MVKLLSISKMKASPKQRKFIKTLLIRQSYIDPQVPMKTIEVNGIMLTDMDKDYASIVIDSLLEQE